MTDAAHPPPHKPATLAGDLRHHLPPALAPLVAERRWVVWRWKTSDTGKLTKVPYRPEQPRSKASSTAPATWSDHATAVAVVEAGAADGIGFVLHGSAFAAFDLDNCRDPESGAIAPWARDLIDQAQSYCEVTPSETGVRIIGRASGGKVHRKQPIPGTPGASLETFRRAERYIAVTGQELGATAFAELADLDRLIDDTVARLNAAQDARGKKNAQKTNREANREGHGANAFREASLPPELLELVRFGVPVGRRSQQFHHAVGWLKQLGWSVADITVLLGRYPAGIAEKYFVRRDLDREIERSYARTADRPEAATRGRPHQQAIAATPFVWIDPAMIRPREWLYGREFIRRFVTATIAPGGAGKSSHAIAEVLAMVSGQNLIGDQPVSALRCWLWNGEDPEDELQRRITAAMLHYKIESSGIEGRLFVYSGRKTEIVIARQDRSGVAVAEPVVEALIAAIRANRIDHVTIDPFVSSHQVVENDNPAVDRVAKTYGRIADVTGCAFNLVHHSRKTGGAEITVEDSRGAVALIAAARIARVLNVMTEDEAAKAGIENRRCHFRLDNGKANLALPTDRSRWFKIQSVELGNGNLNVGGVNMCGDSVGVVTGWEWPNPLDDVTVVDLRAAQAAVAKGRWRENIQAKDWVGKPIAQALRLNLSTLRTKPRSRACSRSGSPMACSWWSEARTTITRPAASSKSARRPSTDDPAPCKVRCWEVLPCCNPAPPHLPHDL